MYDQANSLFGSHPVYNIFCRGRAWHVGFKQAQLQRGKRRIYHSIYLSHFPRPLLFCLTSDRWASSQGIDFPPSKIGARIRRERRYGGEASIPDWLREESIPDWPTTYPRSEFGCRSRIGREKADCFGKCRRHAPVSRWSRCV